MIFTRRSFLSSASALAALGGCRSMCFCGGRPNLRFGVISDIHVITPDSSDEFEGALRYFRDRKADAVMVCGDLTDWGLVSNMKNVAAAWNRVFPGNRTPDGRHVERLFCSGNHDYEGWWYGDMTMEMHALGFSEDEALSKLGFKKWWEEIFQEEWAPIRRHTVNGYDFIGGEWHGYDKAPGFNLLPEWLGKNGATIDPSKPFFYFQHPPIAMTTGDSRRKGHAGSKPDMTIHNAIAAFPNAVTFTGHCHWTFNDCKSIWQDGFTSVAVPSMSYTSIPGGYENGMDVRTGKSKLAMPKIASRPNLEEAQGYFVSVYDDRIEIEKRDFEQNADAGTWIVPLPAKNDKPYGFGASESREPVPQFPAGATLKTYTRNYETRADLWGIMMCFNFPTAAGCGWRAFDYEVRTVLENGTVALVKRFLSPAFHKLPQNEPAVQHFYFNVDELPQDVFYRFEVYPRNSFGVRGRPLVTDFRRGKPGLGHSRRG